MGTQTRRWARPRRRARYGPGVTLLAVTFCLFMGASLVRLLLIQFDLIGAGLLVVLAGLLVFVVWPVLR
jgi:hypothetical protein